MTDDVKRGRPFDVDLPCPNCGGQGLHGFYFLTADGAFVRTGYVCPRCGWEPALNDGEA